MNLSKEKKLLSKTMKTPLKFHWSAAFVPLAMVLAVGPLKGVVWSLIVFMLVLLHELGHVWAARRYGVYVSCISFRWLGGLAQMDGIELMYKWKKNLFISIMGPAVSLLLAFLFFFIDALIVPGLINTSLLFMIACANVAFFVFNMLPVYPMDGGRVIYSIVYKKVKSPKKAIELTTKISYIVGPTLALICFICGQLAPPSFSLSLNFAGIILLAVVLLGYMSKKEFDKFLKW